MNVDGILEKYRSAIDQTLGQGQLDSVLRRASVADALAYGQPSATAVTPRYAPMGQTGGSPVGSGQFLGDLLTQIAHRPSGTPGQSPAPADMAGIYARRAGNQLAEQGLMDDRAVAEAEMVNRAVQEAQGIRGQLGVAGAEAAMGEGRLQSEEQQAVNDMLASFMETETQAGTAAAEREWESEKLLAELAGKKEIAEIGAAGKSKGQWREETRDGNPVQVHTETGEVKPLNYPERKQTLEEKVKEEEALTTARGRANAPFKDKPVTSRTLTIEEKEARGLNKEVSYQEDTTGKVTKIGDVAPSKTEEAVRKQTVALADARSSIATMREKLKEYGLRLIPSREKSELQTAYTNVLLRAKDLYQLGALAGPDLEILQQFVKNPTAVFARADNILAQLDEADKIISTAESNLQSEPEQAGVSEETKRKAEAARAWLKNNPA